MDNRRLRGDENINGSTKTNTTETTLVIYWLSFFSLRINHYYYSDALKYQRPRFAAEDSERRQPTPSTNYSRHRTGYGISADDVSWMRFKKVYSNSLGDDTNSIL